MSSAPRLSTVQKNVCGASGGLFENDWRLSRFTLKQHVAYLVVAGQKVAVRNVDAKAHGEQDRRQGVS